MEVIGKYISTENTNGMECNETFIHLIISYGALLCISLYRGYYATSIPINFQSDIPELNPAPTKVADGLGFYWNEYKFNQN